MELVHIKGKQTIELYKRRHSVGKAWRKEEGVGSLQLAPSPKIWANIARSFPLDPNKKIEPIVHAKSLTLAANLLLKRNKSRMLSINYRQNREFSNSHAWKLLLHNCPVFPFGRNESAEIENLKWLDFVNHLANRSEKYPIN